MNLISAPPTGLRLSFLFGSYVQVALFFGMAVAALGAGNYWQANQIRQILGDQQIWDRGVDARWASLHGSSTSHDFILTDYKLDVDYRDVDGVLHHNKASFSTMFKSVDRKSPVIVRYDPKAVDSFALSWAIDVIGSRWVASIFLICTFLLIGVSGIFAARTRLRLIRDARQCLSQCEEISLEVTKVIETTRYGKRTGVRRFLYRAPGADGRRPRQATFGKKSPLFVDGNQRQMLALHPPLAPDRAVVLRDDLYPFRFSAEVGQLLRDKLQSK